jgi:ABC-type antimicrobial peptide transport system permease subunit
MYHFPGEAPSSMLYLPHRQQPRPNMVLLAQTAGPSAEPLSAMRELVSALDPDVPVYDAQTIERFYGALAVSLASVVLSMIGGIGVMGVVITVIGLYALVSYTATRRTREIGIRIAVGATYGRVLRLLLRQGLAPVWIGLGVGLLLSGATARILPAFVPLSEAYDGRALYGLVPVLLAVTLLAAFLPARRAARVNPMVALRDE